MSNSSCVPIGHSKISKSCVHGATNAIILIGCYHSITSCFWQKVAGSGYFYESFFNCRALWTSPPELAMPRQWRL